MERRNNEYRRVLSKVRAQAALALLFVAGGRAEADAIVRTDGRRLDGVQIIAARWDQILYKQGNDTSQLQGEKVRSIERDSVALARVRSALASGDHAQAAAQLQRVEDGLQGWERVEAQYLKGRIHLDAGDYRKAEEAFVAYIQANQESKDYWVPHAVEGRGLAALELKLGGAAEQHFKDLAGYGPTWKLRAKLGQARGLLLREKYAEARAAFNEVAADSSAPAALRQEALVGKFRAMVLHDQHAAAIPELEQAFFQSGSAEARNYGPARAEATLLMGLAHRKQGGKANLELAEIWFLRAAVLYGQHPSVYKDACRELAAVYKELGREDRAAEWSRRAGTSG